MRDLAPIIGATLRAVINRERATNECAAVATYGVVVLSRHLTVETTTPTGSRWWAALRDARGTGEPAVPAAIWAAAARLRAPVSGRVASVSADSAAGLVRVEAAYADGRSTIAIVLAPERTPPAPRIPERWERTQLEQRVTGCLLRGTGRPDVARISARHL